MEFDSNISLNAIVKMDVVSRLEPDAFGERVWDIARFHARETGEGGGAEIWLDYSDRLWTKHIMIDFSQIASSGEGNTYHVVIKAGKRQNQAVDIVMCLLLLAAFWMAHEAFTVSPDILHIAGFILPSAALAVLAFFRGRKFGAEEAAYLENEIKKII